jgi:hypothetical protein
MSHPPGTVGICAQETGRYTAFTESMASLQSPPGTVISWAYGSDIVTGMNTLVDGMQGEWLWLMGDDHVFDPDLLMRLLDHRVDVLVPVCLMRQSPFWPVAKTSSEQCLDLTSVPRVGLVELYETGSAGMLIRKSVIERVRAAFAGSVFERGDVSEDYLLCRRLRELGITIHCDLGSRLGHMTATAVWPGEVDDAWCVDLLVSDSYRVQLGITT